MSEFDSKAREWDKDKSHLERTFAIAEKMIELIPMHAEMTAMEYGAGTGLLSFALKDRFRRITMIDTSKEMTQVSYEKIEASHSYNMIALNIDIQKEDIDQQFDIIYNQMVLHHVKDTSDILKRFYYLLNHEGYLAIADLYSEDGTFHGKGADVHLGFDVHQLVQLMEKVGFTDIRHENCYTLQKVTESGEVKTFPLFLIIGKKA